MITTQALIKEAWEKYKMDILGNKKTTMKTEALWFILSREQLSLEIGKVDPVLFQPAVEVAFPADYLLRWHDQWGEGKQFSRVQQWKLPKLPCLKYLWQGM